MLRRLLRKVTGWLRSPEEGLRQRVLHGGVWATFLNVADRVLKITRVVVLANLLSPADFGLMGIALLTLAILKKLTHMGFDPALVQREEANVDTYLDTVWTMKLARAASLFVIVFLGAPFIASAFGEPRAEPILQVMAAGPVVRALVNPAVVYFRKDIEFHKQFLYQMSGVFVGLVVAVAFALVYRNVWALVFGALAERGTQLLISYVLSDYRPRPGFKRDAARDVVSFGKWIWATGVLVLVATQGDDAFVGWFLTATALGFYQMAFRLSNAPATEVAHVISSVMFPAFSKLQNDREQLREAFFNTVRVTFLVGMPMATGIYLVAPAFVPVVLGPEWRPMVPAMQVLAVAGMLRAVTATGGALFRGYGVPEWDFWMNLLSAVTIVGTIWPLTDALGITGASVSIALGFGTTMLPWLYKTADITGISRLEYARPVLVSTVGAAIMSGPVLVVLHPSWLRLSLAIAVGAAVYVAAVYVIHLSLGEDLFAEFAGMIRG